MDFPILVLVRMAKQQLKYSHSEICNFQFEFHLSPNYINIENGRAMCCFFFHKNFKQNR